MKLHLPCRLRAAVMALFATAVISPSAFAASPVYWTKVNELKSDRGIATSVNITGLGAFNGAFHYENLANTDLQNTDWTMTVSGTGFNTPSENANETFPASLIGFTGGDQYPFTSFDNPTADTLTQGFILGFGYGSGSNELYFGSEAGWVKLGKVKEYTKENLSYEVTLTYVGRKFSIDTLTINGADFALPNTVKNLALHMPAANKVYGADGWSPGSLTVVTANGGNSEVTILSPTGAEAWHVNGEVTVYQWNWDKFEGPGGEEGTLFTRDELTGELLPVHFVGNTGTIMLDEAYIAGDNPDEYTLGNKLSAGVDMADLKGGCSFGFGAVAGATLTIEDGATATTTDDAGNTTAASGIFTHMSQNAGLRLYGDGTVVIECATGNVRSGTMGATTHTGNGTLTIVTNGNEIVMGDINADNATIGAYETLPDAPNAAGTGKLVIANTKDVKIKELIANTVTIANGGYVSDLNVTNLTLEGGVLQTGNEMLGKNTGHYDIQQDATLVVGKDLSVGSANIAGNLSAENGTVWINAGKLTISGIAAIQNLASTSGCELNVAGGTVEITGTSEVYSSVVSDGGQLEAADLLTPNGLTVNGTESLVKLNTVTVKDEKSVSNDGISITKKAAPTRTTENAILSGDVTITGDNISASELNNGSIDIASTAAGTLSIDTMTNSATNSAIAVDGDNVINGITEATDVTATATKTSANTIDATDINTSDGYTIAANSITASDYISSNNNTYIVADADNLAELTKVREMNDTIIDADTIAGANIWLEDITVKNAAISSPNLGMGNPYSSAEATVELSNVDLTNSTISSHRQGVTVTMDKVKMSKNQNFGESFATLTDGKISDSGVPHLVLTGSASTTKLTLDYLTINDTEGAMHFDEIGKEYVIIDMKGNTLDYADLEEGQETTDYSVVTMNIAPYTISSIYKDANGNLVLKGRAAKEEIINELRSTENQAAVMSVLDEVATSPSGATDEMSAIYNYVGNINLYTAEERTSVVSAASGASFSVLAASQRDGIHQSQKNLRNRIIQMGGITTGPEGNMDYVGLQAWIQADASFNTVSDDGDFAGYDYDTYGGTVGFNLNISENCIIGAAFSASYGDVEAKAADHGKATSDAYYLNLFARYQSNRWTHLFLFTAGSNEMELERNVLGMNSKGSTDGYSLSGYYEGGYIFSLNEEATQILQPIFTLNLTSAHVNAYTEEGTIGNAGLQYEGVDAFYGQVGIGARYQGVIHTTEYERNAVLELRAQIVQNFGDATNEAEVSFIGGGQSFTTKGTEVGDTGFQLGVGVSLPIANQTTLFMDADADFRSGANSVHADIGLRYDF